MYLSNLVKLARKLNEATESTINGVDNFFGEIGEGGLFRDIDLAACITQKKLIQKIIDFLIEDKVIIPFTQKCNHCGREQKYPIENCEKCGQPLDKEDSVLYYKVIGEVHISEIERKQRLEARQRLLLSSFRLLQTKLKKKKSKEGDISIILLDLANSTKVGLNPKASIICNTLKKEFYQFVRDVSLGFLKRTEGHWLKADGDSAHVFLLNVEIAKQFVIDFHKELILSNVLNLMKEINTVQSDHMVFVKMQHASSKVYEFQTPDILTLDFTGVEAFIRNNRYEKPIKERIIETFKNKNDYFPYYLTSTIELFKNKSEIIHFDKIAEFDNIDLHVYLPNNISQIIELGDA